MNSKMTINVAYHAQIRNEPLYVRAMILFSQPSLMHEPVKRCANHRIANNGIDIHPKDANILKINDPKAIYRGFEEGSIFIDRLSVLVPIESTDCDDKGKITQMIGLEFGCQNSCSSGINRRPTSIVFTLENDGGDLIGKAVIEFKVCSCPKRDSERDQREKTKRKAEGSCSYPRGKLPKLPKLALVKSEPEESEYDSTNENMNEADSAFPTTIVSITMPTEMVPEVLRHAYNMIAGKMAEESKRSTNYGPLQKCLGDVKKLRKELAKKNA